MKTSTKSYIYELRRGSVKEVCPQCGQRRFVPYVLASDGKTIVGAEYGRCDREQNCGYFRYPHEIKPTTEMKQTVRITELPPRLQFSKEALFETMKWREKTALYGYVSGLFNHRIADAIFGMYLVGGMHDGRSVFWQVAASGEIRGGKIMAYKSDGHRDKEAAHAIGWAHACKELKPYTSGERLVQCFFGEHLIAAYPTDPIVLVESEKTAMLMSVLIPDYIWLASSGAQGVKNAERNAALKGRRVYLMPDQGKWGEWKLVGDLYGWHTSRWTEEHAVSDGCDMWDIAERVVLGYKACGVAV